MPLERAQMRLRIVISGKESRKLRDKVVKLTTKIETEEWNGGELNLVSIDLLVLNTLPTYSYKNKQLEKQIILPQKVDVNVCIACVIHIFWYSAIHDSASGLHMLINVFLFLMAY